MAVLLVALAALAVSGAFASRDVFSMDDSWKFSMEVFAPCDPDAFPIDMTDIQCMGLVQASASNIQECEEACCNSNNCETYQWCQGPGCSPPNSCWVGSRSNCQAQKGWISRGRDLTPTNDSCSVPFCQPGFDDSTWRSLNVPHDFVVEGVFNETADKSHGYLPYGVGWYRKHFTPPASLSGQTIWIEFDGTMVSSQVWLNGIFIGSHQSGYTPYRFYLNSTVLTLGKENVLALRIDATNPDSWWYDGGGIYRHVWLVAANPIHVDPWGVYAPAIVTGNITGGVADAILSPSVDLANDMTSKATATIALVVLDSSDQTVGSASTTVTVNPTSVLTSNFSINLPSARLWSVDTPVLYTLLVTVSVSENVVDVVNVTFGVRKAVFDAELGFFLNDKPVKIFGCANHQDFAAYGVAVPDVLQSHRIAKLKEMGANAWRTAHNVPTKALLDAADRLGFLVWDENHRNGQLSEAEILIKRDRNHPSVIIWSLCNEVLCNTGDTTGDGAKMKALMKSLDPLMNRPVSANNNGLNGKDTILDLQGFDYATSSYDNWHKAAPNIPAISSETSSAVSDRGEYANDEAGGHVSGYDVNAPGWGQTAEVAWDAIDQRSFMAGGFTWTGWDYRGEPTPYAWPDINSHFGIIDMAGFPKDRFYWYQVNYLRPSPPLVHLFPHWNWASSATLNASGNATSHLSPCKGMCRESADGTAANVDIWVFTNADTAELFVNGKSQGIKSAGIYSHAAWSAVPYVPGTLEARVYMNGSSTVLNKATVSTTGPSASLRISIKDDVGSQLHATGTDVALLMVEVLDSNGVVNPLAADVITFQTSGPTTFVGSANGDPACHTSDKSAVRPAFHGLALGVVQSTTTAGTITVTVSAPGLKGASINIVSNPPSQPMPWKL